MWGHVINWEIHDSFSIWNTWEDSQSSFTCPLWLMHLLPVYNMYDHIACTHNIAHNVLRLSKHDDGESSNKYQSSCQDYKLPFWVIGLWEGSDWVLAVLTVTASAGFDPTNRSDLTQSFSIVSCLTAKSIWVPFSTKPIRISETSVQMLKLTILAFSRWPSSGGHANNDYPLF